MNKISAKLPLIGMIAGLLLVGLVSHTPIRHLVQVSPAILALLLSIPRPAWAHCAALPIHIVWLFLMVLIWLYLLGIARVINGTFSPTEIILTVAIGLSCALGVLISVWRRTVLAALRVKVGLFVSFLALQLFSIWLSMQPYISGR